METLMSEKLAHAANALASFHHTVGFATISTEEEYERALSLMQDILDATRETPQREDTTHPLFSLLEWLTPLIQAYETEHFPMPDAEPREVLRFLMAQHDLTQSDLPEVGNQSVISQILAGHRALNARQIAALVERFGVRAEAFMPHIRVTH